MKKRLILNILIIVFACIFVFSGYNIAKTLYDNAKSDKLYNALQDDFVTTVDISSNNNKEGQTQNVKEPSITVDFSALLNVNSEVVGWLYLPNTPINYPVVQAQDNDKYLYLDINGKRLSAGTLFVDYRNKEPGKDTNYFIYGHHMKNGTMLSTIINYKKQTFYDENPVIYYFTPQEKYKIELIAGCIIPGNDKLYSSVDTDPEALVNEYRAKSTFKSNVEIAEEDTLITLSTCTYEYEDARYVVIGKLTKNIEG